MALSGKLFRVCPTMRPDEIASRLGVQHGGDYPVGWFHDGGKLVARKGPYDVLEVSAQRTDLLELASRFADEITADELAACGLTADESAAEAL